MLARFEAERGAELGLAWLRGLSAVAAFVGSLGLLLAKVPVAIFLIGALGLALSFAWLVQSRRSARRAQNPAETYLAVHARGLLWADPPKAPIWVSWTSVAGLEVDEERLDILVERKAAPPLHIEPRYPGVEIHELVRTLRNAWSHAHDSQDA